MPTPNHPVVQFSEKISLAGASEPTGNSTNNDTTAKGGNNDTKATSQEVSMKYASKYLLFPLEKFLV